MAESDSSVSSAFNRVTVLAKQRLQRLSRQPEQGFLESYLFRNDHVCGIRIQHGPFSAKWIQGDAEIQFFRGPTAVGTISLDIQTSRAA